MNILQTDTCFGEAETMKKILLHKFSRRGVFKKRRQKLLFVIIFFSFGELIHTAIFIVRVGIYYVIY